MNEILLKRKKIKSQYSVLIHVIVFFVIQNMSFIHIAKADDYLPPIVDYILEGESSTVGPITGFNTCSIILYETEVVFPGVNEPITSISVSGTSSDYLNTDFNIVVHYELATLGALSDTTSESFLFEITSLESGYFYTGAYSYATVIPPVPSSVLYAPGTEATATVTFRSTGEELTSCSINIPS